MGRGRAKAKQTKVARELKYSSPGMNLDRLSQDLHSDRGFGSPTPAPTSDDVETAWSGADEDEEPAAS